MKDHSIKEEVEVSVRKCRNNNHWVDKIIWGNCAECRNKLEKYQKELVEEAKRLTQSND